MKYLMFAVVLLSGCAQQEPVEIDSVCANGNLNVLIREEVVQVPCCVEGTEGDSCI